MLRTMPSLDVLRREMRRRICSHCNHRPRHSESFGAEVVRPCEVACPRFIHLPTLRKVAILADPMIHPRRDAVRQWIEQTCDDDRASAAAAGPLARYREDVIRAVIDTVGDG
jgi:hypothetical protein